MGSRGRVVQGQSAGRVVQGQRRHWEVAKATHIAVTHAEEVLLVDGRMGWVHAGVGGRGATMLTVAP